jgi:hypothetical protein
MALDKNLYTTVRTLVYRKIQFFSIPHFLRVKDREYLRILLWRLYFYIFCNYPIAFFSKLFRDQIQKQIDVAVFDELSEHYYSLERFSRAEANRQKNILNELSMLIAIKIPEIPVWKISLWRIFSKRRFQDYISSNIEVQVQALNFID